MSPKFRFQCRACNAILEAGVNRAGDVIPCPKCRANIQIPAAPVPPPPIVASPPSPETAIATTAPETEILDVLLLDDDGPLSPCSACGRNIAKQAESCPGCGAPNTWRHAEISRFFKSIASFDFERSVKIEFRKYVLTGVDTKKSAGPQSVASFANRFGMIGSFGAVITADFGRQMLNNWAQQKVKAFRIDFSTTPPSWGSTDDEWWIDVKIFFGLHQRRRRNLPAPK
jgi:hypothetical protein